jgi:hypothetical protein
MVVKIFDSGGEEQTWDWLAAEYGSVNVRQAGPGHGYRVLELREQVGQPSLDALVLDGNGRPQPGILVARRWPYRQENAELPALPQAAATWYERGVSGRTSNQGTVGFATGGGDFYDPSQQSGASTLWVEGNSDAVEGLGVLRKAGYPHLRVVFKWTSDGPPPEPPPVPPPPEPPPEPPPPEPPPGPAPEVIAQVKSLIYQAQALLNQALELLEG